MRAHDVLLCIQTGKTVHDAERLKFRTDQLYFKPASEMADYFKDTPEALANTVAIARRCHLEFDFKTYHFPKFDTRSTQSADEFFEHKTREGFERVMARVRAKDPQADEALYRQRLDYEIGVIQEMGFSSYFLIVSDFIRYAKESGIPVGPGRGSAAGSLVAYSLGITDLDPLAHGLIFERFLNPARKSMPDIDVDFCIDGREDVYKYVVERYGGGDYVAQIITFGKLKTRAVIRDVGRALDIPLQEVDAIAKMVPDVLNISLDAALAQEPRLRELIAQKAEIRRADPDLPRAGGAAAARLDPCGRGGDLRPAAGGIPAAVPGQEGRGDHPVRHEDRREDRAGQVRLPGAAQPHGDRRRPSGSSAARARRPPTSRTST